MYETNAPMGADLLDRVRPGWADKIDVETLDLSSCTRCVLGQMYGDYDIGLRALWPVGLGGLLGFAQRHGFVPYSPGRGAELQAEWTELIRERRALSDVSDV